MEDREKDLPAAAKAGSFGKSHPFVTGFLISVVGMILVASVPVILIAGRIFMKQIGLDFEAAGATYGFYIVVGTPWFCFVYWSWGQFSNLLDPSDNNGTRRSAWTSLSSNFGSTLGAWTGVGLIGLVAIWMM